MNWSIDIPDACISLAYAIAFAEAFIIVEAKAAVCEFAVGNSATYACKAALSASRLAAYSLPNETAVPLFDIADIIPESGEVSVNPSPPLLAILKNPLLPKDIKAPTRPDMDGAAPIVLIILEITSDISSRTSTTPMRVFSLNTS